jgi:uncharacterized membrane protein YeaQ/YmgE (transglycosylase-associated protein family)
MSVAFAGDPDGPARMELLIWLVFGGVIGGAAGWLVRPRTAHPVALDVVAGITGSGIGGLLMTYGFDVDLTEQGGRPWLALLASLIGAVLVLLFVRLVRGRR